MAHNFKSIGARYISKSGHDSNDGLTPDTPRRSITDANCEGSKTIIGAGHYTGGSLLTAHQYLDIYGDGKVILDSVNISANRYFKLNVPRNLEFRNSNISCREGYVNGIIAKNCSLHGSVASANYLKCILINSILNMNTVFRFVTYSVVINCTGNLHGMYDSYIDRNTQLTYVATVPDIARCNFRGTILMPLTSGGHAAFAIQDQYVGTPQDNGYETGVSWLNEANLTSVGYKNTIAGWDNLVATCINREPLFNNESIYDFTLQAGSPHIGRGGDGSNLGGTEIAISVYNADNNTGNVEVIPSATIDTTDPNSYTVKVGETEGYIDYIQKIGSSDFVLKEIAPITVLEFDSETTGGTLGNKDVPDSEPLTIEYPRKITTTSTAPDTTTINITAHDIIVGEFVRYAGQDREVISTTVDTITVDTAFRSAVGTGVNIQVGAKVRIGALNPNRLTFMMRTSKEFSKPTLDSQWDNDIDPIHNKAGAFLTQEWNQVPGYYIDTVNNEVWGSGDSETPQGLVKNEISCKWIHIRVYIRNNYES